MTKAEQHTQKVENTRGIIAAASTESLERARVSWLERGQYRIVELIDAELARRA